MTDQSCLRRALAESTSAGPRGRGGRHTRSDQFHPSLPKIFEGPIVIAGVPRRIFSIASGDYHDDALPGSGQQHSISVFQISLPLSRVDVLPSISPKGPVLPAFRGE